MKITEIATELLSDPFLDDFQSSENAEINYDRSRGRYVTAKCDISINQSIFNESAHVYMPLDQSFDSACHFCLIDLKIGHRKVCGKCRVIHYCSVECQTNHWPIHKLECDAMKYWFDRIQISEESSRQIDQSLICLIGRAFLIHKHLKSITTNPVDKSITSPSNKPLKPILQQIVDESKLVHSVKGEDPESQSNNQSDDESLKFFVAQVSLYVTVGAGCASLAEYQSIRSSIIEWRSKIQRNAFRLYSQAGDRVIARGLFVRSSMLNHSCLPNCVVVNVGASIYVRPIRQIYSGEELTISYVDVGNVTSARRFALLSTYHFLCKCAMCSETDRDPAGLSERDRQLDGYRCLDRECSGLMAWKDNDTAPVDQNMQIKCSRCNKSSFVSSIESQDDRLTGQLMDALDDNKQAAQSLVDSHSTILQQLNDFLSPRNMFHYRYLTLGLSSGIWTDPVSRGTMFARLIPYVEFMYGALSLEAISVHLKYQETCFVAKRLLQENENEDEAKIIAKWRAALSELPQLEERARTVCGESHWLFKRILELQQKGRDALLTPANPASNWMTLEQ